MYPGIFWKGYNDEFVENMNFVVDKLRNVPGTKVNLVCNTDVLCSKCVNKLDENQCLTQDKVAEFDRKTLEVFGLEETEYVYSEVVEHIKSIATEEKLDYICGNCSWHAVSACRHNILSK